MRPIDELREKIDLWKKSTTDIALMSVLNDVLKQIDVAIYEMDNQEAESTWHRVEDELPESGEFGKIVLACNDVGTVNAAFLSSSGKWYAANNTMYDAWTWMPNVTHWMPLPEPPKEED